MGDTKSLEDLIRNVDLFQGLDTRDLNKILKVASGKKVASGEAVFREGDPGDCFFVIIDGKVEICKKMPGDRLEVVATMKAGDYFGEMALLDGEPRSASVIATADTRFLEVRNSAFIKLIMGDDAFARKVLWAFCMTFAQRLRHTNALLGQFASSKNHSTQNAEPKEQP